MMVPKKKKTVLNNYSECFDLLLLPVVIKVKADFLFFFAFVLFFAFFFVILCFQCVASTVTFFWRVRSPNPPMRGYLEGTQSID